MYDYTCNGCGTSFSRKGKAEGRPHCSHICYLESKRHTDTIEQRFWEKVQKGKGCWLWMGTKTIGGYGVLHEGIARGGKDKKIYAHRFSYELHYGKFPNHLYICHRCDVTACIRPDHLFLGTNADNQADMVLKGRSAKGEAHSQSKLTVSQIKKIIRLHDSGMTQVLIAKQFSISPSHVSNIVNQKVWTHLV